jgi:hypothetical protein
MSRLLCVALMPVLLVLACTAEKPQKERPPKLSSRPINQAPPPELEPLPVEPTQPGPSLEPAPVMNQWWCLCYRRQGTEGQEPVTACREQESQCRKLEQRVAKGNDEIIAGSLMQACRSMTGAHPGDVAGTREQWQPSALPGAWVSEGACLLVDAVVPEVVGETVGELPDLLELTGRAHFFDRPHALGLAVAVANLGRALIDRDRADQLAAHEHERVHLLDRLASP